MKQQKKAESYGELAAQLAALMEGERDLTANLANASAALGEFLEEINWVGFYRRMGEELVLGPFQGKVACIRIPVGRGVCGTAALMDELQLVDDVHTYPGHIACDGASNAEIVLPLHVRGEVVGVLDIDSPVLGRFRQEDAEGLLLCAAQLEKMWEQSEFSG